MSCRPLAAGRYGVAMTYEECLSAAIIVQLRVELAARGWSQQEFSKMIDIEPETLSRYMKGHRHIPMRTFIRMAQVFGMKAAQLLAGAEDRMNNAGTASPEAPARQPIN